jgi:hypothetical protein
MLLCAGQSASRYSRPSTTSTTSPGIFRRRLMRPPILNQADCAQARSERLSKRLWPMRRLTILLAGSGLGCCCARREGGLFLGLFLLSIAPLFAIGHEKSPLGSTRRAILARTFLTWPSLSRVTQRSHAWHERLLSRPCAWPEGWATQPHPPTSTATKSPSVPHSDGDTLEVSTRKAMGVG